MVELARGAEAAIWFSPASRATADVLIIDFRRARERGEYSFNMTDAKFWTLGRGTL